jgi:hypothetical protein
MKYVRVNLQPHMNIGVGGLLLTSVFFITYTPNLNTLLMITKRINNTRIIELLLSLGGVTKQAIADIVFPPPKTNVIKVHYSLWGTLLLCLDISCT